MGVSGCVCGWCDALHVGSSSRADDAVRRCSPPSDQGKQRTPNLDWKGGQFFTANSHTTVSQAASQARAVPSKQAREPLPGIGGASLPWSQGFR